MREFIGRDFLLTTYTSRLLYHLYAKKLPIYERFSRFSHKDIAENRRYTNIGEFWLSGESGRQILRLCGTDGSVMTDEGSDYDRFRLLCRAMPSLIGNPVHHLCHLSLHRDFDCDLPLNEKNCDIVWSLAAERLSADDASVGRVLSRMGVKRLSVPVDPFASARDFSAAPITVDPVFSPFGGTLPPLDRPDFAAALRSLGGSTVDLKAIETALSAALDRFVADGGKVAYHELDLPFFVRPDPYHAEQVLIRAADSKALTREDSLLFGAQILRFLGREYFRRGLTLYLRPRAASPALIAYLHTEAALPRTVLLCASAAESEAAALLFRDLPIVAQMMLSDRDLSPEAAINQLRTVAAVSAFGRFGGLASAADSPLTLTRHDYFRRLLCRTVGEWIEDERYPVDMESAAQLICDICCNHAKNR